ncbi:MAG: histidinol-phosphate transaminase [Candidatus Peribacteraceae bacterium]|nr:histidinol-phosphate transaminase [Candidatus Peribacteraceae bacterium]
MNPFSLPVPARVKKLQPYVCARSTCKGDLWTFFDANESPLPLAVDAPTIDGINRYPDPTADALRKDIGDFYGVSMDQVFVGNGCDELISLCVQAFVRPSYWVVAIEPTYGMYQVCADAYGVSFKSLQMEEDFSIDIQKLKAKFERADVLFLCSPNNPTGTIFPESLLQWVIEEFSGLVVIDEAYGEFADANGTTSCIKYVKQDAKNVLVLRTFSKAFGAAGIRLGYGIADKQIIQQLMKVKMPYNVNVLTQQIGRKLWQKRNTMEANVRQLQEERIYLESKLQAIGFTIWPSVTNFFLAEPPSGIRNDWLYEALRDDFRIVLRNFGSKKLLENTLRITVGTCEENERLLSAISSLL